MKPPNREGGCQEDCKVAKSDFQGRQPTSERLPAVLRTGIPGSATADVADSRSATYQPTIGLTL